MNNILKPIRNIKMSLKGKGEVAFSNDSNT